MKANNQHVGREGGVGEVNTFEIYYELAIGKRNFHWDKAQGHTLTYTKKRRK